MQPFDLGQVLMTSEAIKSRRQDRESQRVRDLYFGKRAQQEDTQFQQEQQDRTQQQQLMDMQILHRVVSEVEASPDPVGATRNVVSSPQIVEVFKRLGIDPAKGLDPNASPEQVKQGASQLRQQLEPFLQQQQQGSLNLEQIVGPDGQAMFVPREAAVGQQPYQKPDAPPAPASEQLVSRQTAPGMMQYFSWNPKTRQLTPVGEPFKVDNAQKLRPVPQAAAQGIIENRTSIGKIDRALAAAQANQEAFGLQNMLPDAATQRLPGKQYKGGVDARAKVADIGSLIIHDRSGAAVTISEFPRLKPFVPQATDDADNVKTKLTNLRANLAAMQDEIESFYSPETGYRSIPRAPQAAPGGQQPPTEAPAAAVQHLQQHPELKEQFRAKYGYVPGE